MVLADARVAEQHVQFTHEDGWVARDLGTSTGTWIRGSRITDVRVGNGVTMRLGHPVDGSTVELYDDAIQPSAPPSPGAGSAQVGPPAGPGMWIGPGLVIGRAPDNDLVLTDDLLASRRHAAVRPMPEGGYEVIDLDSSNRTFVNGVVVDAGPLRDGDVLTIGASRLVLRSGWLIVAAREQEDGVRVDHLTFQLGNGRVLTDRVSLTLRGPALMAVIGPSGAGKSTLLRLMSGELPPSSGAARYHGVTVHNHQGELRSRIGVVPQHTIAHRQLSTAKALGYTAELRLTGDTSGAERRSRVEEVLHELGLSEHGSTRIDRLSGGQQRRLSIAFELLTRPSLLLLDEPTSGLDPGLVRLVMNLLRGLADTGRQVILTTHDLGHLEMCDTVLILVPGGRTSYLGSPIGIPAFFGTDDWADIFDSLNRPTQSAVVDPVPPRRRRLGRRATRTLTEAPEGPQSAMRARWTQQLAVVARRQLAILSADRPYAAFLLGLPLVLATLALTVPGGAGLSPPADPSSTEATRLLVLLVVGAAFMGTAATIRDLVAERGIYQHERAAGLLPTAYIGAKLLVFAMVAIVQSMILVGLFLLVRAGPGRGSLLASGNVELFVAVTGTTLAGAVLGLAISSLVATVEQTMPPLVIAVMAQFVLCGGLIEITGRPVLEQLSWLSPARWGYAAAASTTDVRTIVVTAPADPLWTHSAATWTGAVAMLVLLTAASA
ncbi:MAG: ATP-binding cassette domain-containing protein, partial [Geodermatophilaceae bacterium]|nr:ATP-binding cassette domain-containing protein [Geodermatophilaceae bacterium]